MNYDQKLVSVIVPVYSHPELVKGAVDSLLAQSYGRIEVILVDDASPDGCDVLCDEFAKTDGRVRVIHKENGGVSSARNAGLSAAVGEYITFFDSDDKLEKDHIETLVEALEEHCADLSSAAMVFYRSSTVVKEGAESRRTVRYTSLEALRSMHLEEAFNGYVMNKLFRAEVLKGLFFAEDVHIHEDMLFLWEVLLRCKTVVHTDRLTYRYLIHEKSAMNRQYSPKFESAVVAAERMLSLAKEKKPELIPFANKTYLFAVLSVLNKRLQAGEMEKNTVSVYRDRIRKAHSADAFSLIKGIDNRISYRMLLLGTVPFLLWKRTVSLLRRFR